MLTDDHREKLRASLKKAWETRPKPTYTFTEEDLTSAKRPHLIRGFVSREELEGWLLCQSGKTIGQIQQALGERLGKPVSHMTVFGLIWSYRLRSKLPPVRRERQVDPGLSDASTLGPNRTIFMIGGVSGSGKSWVCKSLGDAVHYVEYDKTTDRITALQEATFQDKPIVFDPVTHLRQYINRNPAVTFRTAIILESDEVLLARLRGRGSLMMELTPGLKKRVKRNSRYVEDAEFSGTSDEVLAWLRQQLSS